MLELSGLEFTPMRHVLPGALGSGGELPSGWSPEQLSVEILNIDHTHDGPGLKLRLQFSADIEGDFVSLTLSPFRSGHSGDVFICSTHFMIDEIENIDSAFGIIREWEVNGPFIGQSTREVSISSGESRIIVALQLKNDHRALQPLVTLRRKRKAGGSCVVSFRRTIFANLYDCPGWLAP